MTRRLAARPLRRDDQHRRDNSWLVPGGARHEDAFRWLESREDGRPAVNVDDALAHLEREKGETGGPQHHEQPDDHRDPLRAVHSVRIERCVQKPLGLPYPYVWLPRPDEQPSGT